jgi:hypothetical protein
MRLVMHRLGGGRRIGGRKCFFQAFLKFFVALGLRRIVVAGDLGRSAPLFIHFGLPVFRFHKKWGA